MEDLPAWAIQVAAEQAGYEQLADAPEAEWPAIYEAAEYLAE